MSIRLFSSSMEDSCCSSFLSWVSRARCLVTMFVLISSSMAFAVSSTTV
ncbi:MAG: hypothetical protein ACK55Z_23215 [bacterium]